MMSRKRPTALNVGVVLATWGKLRGLCRSETVHRARKVP